MAFLRSFRQLWWAPICVGLIGVVLSVVAYRIADRADELHVIKQLESRADWRARDIEAKIRLSGNAVENVSVAMAANPALGAAPFAQLASRARRGIPYVHALEWAPRVPRDGIAAFERSAQAQGFADYRVFDVSRDFRREPLADRPEYFPVLYEARFGAPPRARGLALGRFDGRRIPMDVARDEGGPVATAPVRPIGPPSPQLLYLLFWPVYDGIDVPADVASRRAKLRGYAVGNYDLTGLLAAALRNTQAVLSTIRFSIAPAHMPDRAPEATLQAAAVYSPVSKTIVTGAEAAAPPASSGARPAVRLQRHFDVFGQHWFLTFDYSPAAVAGLRSHGAWGWLVAGLLLTATLVLYLVRAQGRTLTVERLIGERTAELQRTSAQLQQAQKMEAIGNLTGGMAHDFNNLLTVVVGNLDVLRDTVSDNPRAGALVETAMRAAIRGADLIQQLLAFARRQPLKPKLTDINELVVRMAELLKRTLGENIVIDVVSGENLWPAMIDPAQLDAAIVNLATNARDAMPRGGQLTIETRNAHLDADYVALNPEAVAGDYVLLEVSDTGSGMAPETLAKAFEPFFTTKEVGEGSGLGLSMVFGFVKQSDGHIKIYSEPGQGTTVRLYLPRAAQAGEAQAATAAVAPSRAGRETILVVEDNEEVRNVVVRQLGDLGYTALAAANPQAALAILKDPANRIDLLFTDLIMPGGMSGHELARAALALRPGLAVLYTSGYPGNSLRNGDRIREDEHFLGKPYRRDDLARKLHEVFGR